MTKEESRIYFRILEHLKAFLQRPKMFATSVEATYTTFRTLICCLDVVTDNEEGLVAKHRKFMAKHKNPGVCAYPSGITQDELIEHFQSFYDTHIVMKLTGDAFTPEEQKEFLGNMPVRQEIEVLGPDDINSAKLG